MIRELLPKLIAGEHLSREEAAALMGSIMEGKATPAQIAGAIIALKIKGEEAEEVSGFVSAMREHALTIKIDDPAAVDGVGTGGDGSHSFNISTAASLVSAAAGVTVAKHGNRSVSSRCGSADLLEATGANIDPGPEIVRDCINQVGFGFMFAPRFHPAMKHAAVPRREMGVRTIFNILGPMTNPAGVKRQLTGVYSPGLMPLVAEVLAMTGSEHAIVAHSRDGMDEFSISSETDYLELKDGTIDQKTFAPEDAGLTRYGKNALAGGEAAENLAVLERVLAGETGAYRDAVILNAGGMIYLAGQTSSIADGVSVAASTIDRGAAKQKLTDWIAATKK